VGGEGKAKERDKTPREKTGERILEQLLPEVSLSSYAFCTGV
jgi:hypothetical protein